MIPTNEPNRMKLCKLIRRPDAIDLSNSMQKFTCNIPTGSVWGCLFVYRLARCVLFATRMMTGLFFSLPLLCFLRLTPRQVAPRFCGSGRTQVLSRVILALSQSNIPVARTPVSLITQLTTIITT